MRQTSLLLILAGAVPSVLYGQIEATGAPTETSEAQIIGDVSDGNPPEPAPPSVKLVVAPEDILESKMVDMGERQVTMQKISPLELPAIPEPSQPPNPLSPEIQQQLQELQETQPETTFVFIGATVFHSADLPAPRTLLHVWSQESQTSYSAWSSANWNWLGGISSFQGADGKKYALIMSHSNMDVGRWAEFLSGQGQEYVPPTVPNLPVGDATFVVTEGTPEAEALAPVNALHQFYNNDSERLKAAYEGRERAERERVESLRTNPPRPKNLVIRHWRMDEAGQEGVTPKAAVAR